MKKLVLKRCLIVLSMCSILVAAGGSAAPPPGDKTLESYLKVFPGVRSIGVIYSQTSLEPTIRQLESGAKTKNIKVVKVLSPTVKEFPAAVTALKNQVDTLWVLDDPLYSVQDVWAFFLFFTIRNQIKTIVSTEKALKEGGFFYFSEGREVILNKRMLDILGIKVSSLAGAVKFYEPGS